MTQAPGSNGGPVSAEDIRQFLHQLLPAHAATINIDTDIVDSGVLDSVAMVELLLWLETDKGVEIAEEDMIPDNFRSISTLHQFIETSRS